MLILTDFLNVAQLACGKNGYDYKSVKRWTSHKKLGYELVECDKVM
jgi:sentrin-specific protease 1